MKEQDRLLLHYSESGNWEAVERLIEQGGVNINVQGDFGNAAIHNAAYFGNSHIVDVLLRKGADINLQDNFGNTALHKAVYYDKKEVVETLLNWGADLDIKNTNERTAYNIAKENCRTEVAGIISQYLAAPRPDVKWAGESSRSFAESVVGDKNSGWQGQERRA